MLLAIETSCDETAVSIFESEPALQKKGDLKIIYESISSQIKIHELYGGVVPEIAAREHITNLPLMVDDALKQTGITTKDLRAIAVTRGPGLKGCLLVGLCYAKGLSYSTNTPLLALNHLEGHIFAADLNNQNAQKEYPVIAMIVSGGHTELVLIEGFRKYRLVAQTRDDAAGETFDKIATLFQLPFPGGSSLSSIAKNGNSAKFKLPIAMAQDPESFSFSGLKTAAFRLVQSFTDSEINTHIPDICASVQEAIVLALIGKVEIAIKKYAPKGFILTGGVAANSRLRDVLQIMMSKYQINFYAPEPKWCTDNASMIGALALRIIADNPRPYLDWRRNINSDFLGPDLKKDIGPAVRWYVDEKLSSDRYS
jgi:N6-L-threonylcarbamoyladenine synthase